MLADQDSQQEHRSMTAPPVGYALPHEGFIRLLDVLRVFPIGETRWWQGVKCGEFPQPVKLSERITAWKVSDIRALIRAYSGEAEEELLNVSR